MTRAREAVSSARFSAFAITSPTSSVKFAMRRSLSAGSGSPLRDATTVPHRRPSTTIGLATDDRFPPRRRYSGIAPELAL